MSIVENQRRRRIFAVFFLYLLPGLSMAAGAAKWRSDVTAELLAQWTRISGVEGASDVSFPGLPADYALPECRQALVIDPVRDLQPGRNGLEISCAAPYWKQHLAVQLHVYREVAVLARAVAADAVVSDDDLSYVRQDTGELSKGFFTGDDPLSGQVMRRTQRAGTVVTPDMVEPPVVIERGDAVQILVSRPGIRIEMKGTALESARTGERLRVRNDQSQKVLTATAVRAGLVQVR
ncbi:flagellar basal body P-ring formation chaperone FlgA [Thalassolituus sp. LLYu03]|uniref:flagellar basal body P-ring formation chaperone FlgA n=1 Tax=Thalassolituus sp. LLYu03 TaxID=3421656 RepID=UPI003D26F7CE